MPADPHRHRGGFVGDLSDEVVDEPHPVGQRPQQPTPDGFGRPCRACVGTGSGQRRERVEGERRAENRGLPEQLDDLLVGGVDAVGDDVAQRARHGHGDVVGAWHARGSGGAQQLGDEQRRPAGPAVQPGGVVACAGTADELGDGLDVERAQLDPAGGHRAQRLGGRPGALLGDDDQHRPRACVGGPLTHREQQGADGGPAGVVGVLDGDEHGAGRGEPGEEPGEGVEGPAVFELGVGPLVVGGGDEVPDLGDQLRERTQPGAREGEDVGRVDAAQRGPDQLHERFEVERAFRLVAGDRQHERTAAALLVGEAVDERAAPDAAVPGDDDQAGGAVGGAGPLPAQDVELGVAADDRLRRDGGVAVGGGGATQLVEEGAGGGRRVAAELLGDRGREGLVGGERVGGPAGAHQPGHDEAARLLVEGVGVECGGGDVDGDVGRPEFESGCGPADPGAVPVAGDAAADVGDPAVGLLARQRHVGGEHPGGELGTGGGDGEPAVSQFELGALDALDRLGEVGGQVGGDEPVAGGGAVDAFAAECAAEPADEGGDVAVGPLGRIAFPHGVDEVADGDELSRALREDGQDTPCLPDGHGVGGSALYGERTEQAQPQVGPGHARTVPGSRGVTGRATVYYSGRTPPMMKSGPASRDP
ncbi:hypothetical protein TOK_2852 [Pseudonocardia sp. N23]|nr:hypothetical protein TOK_2852 [Pseudonocardia sp. N23]